MAGMTDKEFRELVLKRMQMSWLLYGTIYITRDQRGDIVVHDPETITVTVNTPTHTPESQ